MSSKTDYWDRRVNRIFSRTGGWRIGDSVTSHGEELLNDILPRDRYFQHLLRVATGKSQSPELARWVEAAFTSLSWPDPRIWCNTVGALCGDLATRPSAATLMGTLASDSVMYGGGASLGLIRSIRRIREKIGAGWSEQQILDDNLDANNGQLKLMGYSRPLATGDERVPVLINLARELGLEEQDHEVAAIKLSHYLTEKHGECINVGGYIAVMMADHGISDDAFYTLFSLCTMAGVMACYIDSRDRPPNSFMPIPVEEVLYTGRAPRPLPE